MLVYHGEALEADLQRFYQVDLADMYRGAVSPRKIAVYASHLPRGGAVMTRLGGPAAVTAETEAMWGVEYTQMMIAHQQGGGKGQKPKPREYPKGVHDEAEKESRNLSRAERALARQAQLKKTE